MWIMLRTKLPTEVSPPKMSLFWSVLWPGPWDDSMLGKIDRSGFGIGAYDPEETTDKRVKGRLTKRQLESFDYRPLSEEELKKEVFLDKNGFGFVPNWARARKIHYKETDIRIFPHEFSDIDNEKMQFYLNENAFEIVPNSVAENTLIYGSDGRTVEDRPKFISEYPQSEQRLIYEAALIDGCTHAQALIVAFGGDPSDEVSTIPPIGWYKLKPEYASVFCYDWEMTE